MSDTACPCGGTLVLESTVSIQHAAGVVTRTTTWPDGRVEHVRLSAEEVALHGLGRLAGILYGAHLTLPQQRLLADEAIKYREWMRAARPRQEVAS